MTSIFEYNKEEEKKLRKAEYELGYEDGTKTGIEIGTRNGIALVLINDNEKSNEELNNPEEMKISFGIIFLPVLAGYRW